MIDRVLVVALVESVGDACFKKYAVSNKSQFLLFGSIAYILMTYGLIQVWKEEKLGTSNVRWNTYSTILDGLAGLYMGEEYSSNELIGAGVSLAGIKIMES